MSRLPQGLGEPSTTHHSYVSRVDYDEYNKEQKKQKTTIDQLEEAYSSFVASHQDLRRAHEKIITRDKKRDKFFTKMWKGVKGLWKVLKPQRRLPIYWVESDNDSPSEWSDIEEDGDDAGYESDRSP